jgi:3-oxoacyl-[acyl-carrier protein] reductase
MDLKLSGKRVLITGASQGIGYACALAFAREGAQPILVARNAEALRQAADTIEQETRVVAQTLSLDLATDGAATSLAEQVGDLDILVNNAGAIPGGNLEQVNEARWRDAWELKLFGYINLTRAYLSRMEAAGQGVIANVVGMAGVAPRYAYICGGTANAALNAFTQAVGAESQKHGVRVFGVNPSATRTERIVTLSREMALARFSDASRWQELTSELPFARLLEPDEVANFVVFGCSPLAGYLTGTMINLDGGQNYATH